MTTVPPVADEVPAVDPSQGVLRWPLVHGTVLGDLRDFEAMQIGKQLDTKGFSRPDVFRGANQHTTASDSHCRSERRIRRCGLRG